MAYLGSWKLNDSLVITATTCRASSGEACAATSIAYRIYKDDTNAEIVPDTAMTLFDTETGLYLNRIQLAGTAGFEAGHAYTVLVKATVDGVSGMMTHHFQIEAAVSANSVVPDVGITQPAADKIWASPALGLKKLLAFVAGNIVRTSDHIYAYKDSDAATTVMTHTYAETERTVS